MPQILVHKVKLGNLKLLHRQIVAVCYELLQKPVRNQAFEELDEPKEAD